MRKHLDRIRFRGQRRDEFLDLPESPNTSDTECTEEIVIKPRVSASRVEVEELREAEGEQQSEVHKHTCLICDGDDLRNISTRSLTATGFSDPDQNFVRNASLIKPEHYVVATHGSSCFRTFGRRNIEETLPRSLSRL